jgi:hypothetical protein
MHTSPLLHAQPTLPAAASKPAYSTILSSSIYTTSLYTVTIIIAGFLLVCLTETLTFLTSPHGNLFTKATWLLFLFISALVYLACILGSDPAFDIMEWLFYNTLFRLFVIAFTALEWLFDCRIMQWITGGWRFGVWLEKCWAVRWIDEWLGDD